MDLPHEHHKEGNMDKIFRNMPGGDDFLTVSEILKLLGDTTRLQLFWVLCHTEECVINLAAILDISSPAVSHHLRYLKENNLIVSRKVGKEVYYKSSDSDIAKFLHIMTEKIMKTACPMMTDRNSDECENTGKDDIISQIHDYLIDNLDKRITIEELSRKFLMNPTTLKLKFKDTYGHSIAAHIKEHRMEKAAELLISSESSVAEIASLVGYTSQSKFSAAFADSYGIPPLEYRKKYSR